MISVWLSWMVASAIPGLPMITMSAGREMRITFARLTTTWIGSAFAGIAGRISVATNAASPKRAKDWDPEWAVRGMRFSTETRRKLRQKPAIGPQPSLAMVNEGLRLRLLSEVTFCGGSRYLEV